MRIDIITLFPKMFKGPFEESIVRRAQNKSLVEINVHNLRKWTKDKHKTVDGRPYGGGPGMILMIQPIADAIQELRTENRELRTKIVLFDPKGRVFNQAKARQLSKLDHLILICGHYEGIDARVNKRVDEKISIGEYVLTGGELPAMVIIDTIVRLLPGALGNPDSLKEESFPATSSQLPATSSLEYPQYTRPENYKGIKVPPVLISGNHKKIEEWRKKHSK